MKVTRYFLFKVNKYKAILINEVTFVENVSKCNINQHMYNIHKR
jgi:hypothetical protein